MRIVVSKILLQMHKWYIAPLSCAAVSIPAWLGTNIAIQAKMDPVNISLQTSQYALAGSECHSVQTWKYPLLSSHSYTAWTGNIIHLSFIYFLTKGNFEIFFRMRRWVFLALQVRLARNSSPDDCQLKHFSSGTRRFVRSQYEVWDVQTFAMFGLLD